MQRQSQGRGQMFVLWTKNRTVEDAYEQQIRQRLGEH